MGLAWRLPPEPTFEDFFLFLPRKHIASATNGQLATIQRSERALQLSTCNTSEAHELLNAHLAQLHQGMADLQLIEEQMFPKHSHWMASATEDLLPPSLLEALEELHATYKALLQRLEA
jgi:hypothetical protein